MTVKEKKRGRPKGKVTPLSAQAILEMAKLMMREEGKIPSIRKLATKLNIDAMAIYHYFDNKSALLEAITTSLIEDIYEPTIFDKKSCDKVAINNWQQELTLLSKSYLSLLDNYPGLLETLLGMDATSPAHVFIERFQGVIQGLNLSEETMKDALDLLVDYLHGYALALNCQSPESASTSTLTPALTIEGISGPLKLYCLALENC